ncbi:unnamed protein product [Heligmosomoides polygyrus]|uniref:ANF_receptor domain-containing protein n=1 Tax=Heligmosomoides polygyrus TaxID=6339 RepID=A0A183GEA3_HELPZ|nr:unnamed protein product [Heligmosomoides polygyrus]
MKASLTWVFGDCVESTDAGSVIDWIEEGIDVVLGPGCSQSAIISGVVGKYFNFPMVLYAANFASSLLDVENYPTIMTSTWSSLKAFMKKSDQRVGERLGVLLTFCGILLVTALAQQVSAKRITWPAHLIFDNLAHATAHLMGGGRSA